MVAGHSKDELEIADLSLLLAHIVRLSSSRHNNRGESGTWREGCLDSSELFHGYGLREVAGLVHVAAAAHTAMC